MIDIKYSWRSVAMNRRAAAVVFVVVVHTVLDVSFVFNLTIIQATVYNIIKCFWYYSTNRFTVAYYSWCRWNLTKKKT